MLHYNVDFSKLFKMFTIIMLRTTNLLTLILNSFSAPLSLLHAEFLNNRESVLEQMSYNSQLFSLRKLLNDLYDSTSRRFTIVDGLQRDYTMLYRTDENRPLMLSNSDYTLIVRRDTVLQSDEFLVLAPLEAEIDDGKIKSKLNEYKLVTKKYKIRYENI